MRARKFWTPFLCLSAILLSSGLIQAETHYTYAPAPNKAVLNFPLGPGDSVRTSSERRCEIQFDTGTILRLDYDSEVQIETILAPSLTSRSKISNIVLKRGQAYIMYKRYSRPEVFQVFTPNASVKLDHNSVSSIKVEDGLSQVWVDQGKVRILYGPDTKHTHTYKLKKSRAASVTPDHKLLKLTGGLDQEFSLWNKSMNQDFLELHKGHTALPKPIQRPPKLYPPYQMPKELKGVYNKVKDGIASNDPQVMNDIAGSVREYNMVRLRDLHTPRIHERLIDPGTTKTTIKSGVYRESPNPSQAAVNLYWMYSTRSQDNSYQEDRNRSLSGGRKLPSSDVEQNGAHRFRDWNPDAKVASRQGVVLRYVSRQNVIRAPEMSYDRSLQRRYSFIQGRSSGGSYASSGSRDSSGASSSASSGSSSKASGSTSSSSGAGRGSGGRGKK